jgi:hypothetical protein
LAPFEPQSDKDFSKFMDENKNELTDKISGYYEENLKEMRALHK